MEMPPIRIIIFIANLGSGGKERRVIEILTYLKKNHDFEFLVILTEDKIQYSDFFKLNIPYRVLSKKWKKYDLSVFHQFYSICKQFKPQIIHTWGRIQTLYSLPAVIGLKIPLVNSQITSAPPRLNSWSVFRLIDRINFHFSKVILSNSIAGVKSYQPPSIKSTVIYNGINLKRFVNLPSIAEIKSKYRIITPYIVIMVANFTPNKDYHLFYRIAKRITSTRQDITFIGVGGSCGDDSYYKRIFDMSVGNPQILFPGRINEVEALLNACTVGILFTNTSLHGEGISNSIMESMALAKPVIANDSGGTNEIVKHNVNGYLIADQTEEEIAAMVTGLIDDPEKCESFGKESRLIIEEQFSIDKMGKAFEEVYIETLKLPNYRENIVSEPV